MAVRESNLPEGRINGELGRTTGQIKLFAHFAYCEGKLGRKATVILRI